MHDWGKSGWSWATLQWSEAEVVVAHRFNHLIKATSVAALSGEWRAGVLRVDCKGQSLPPSYAAMPYRSLVALPHFGIGKDHWPTGQRALTEFQQVKLCILCHVVIMSSRGYPCKCIGIDSTFQLFQFQFDKYIFTVSTAPGLLHQRTAAGVTLLRLRRCQSDWAIQICGQTRQCAAGQSQSQIKSDLMWDLICRLRLWKVGGPSSGARTGKQRSHTQQLVEVLAHVARRRGVPNFRNTCHKCCR